MKETKINVLNEGVRCKKHKNLACPACKNMKSIKVFFSNGNSIVTSINGTNEEIEKYYLGQTFNLGDGMGGDLMVKAEMVEFLD